MMNKNSPVGKDLTVRVGVEAKKRDVDEFVAQVGEQVRLARMQKKITRKVLSDLSGVSERYLAQLEGGSGNISIALLFRVSHALNWPIDEFFKPLSASDSLTALYRNASPDIQNQVDALLNYRNARAKKAKRICLIGLRGAGKSTLGKLLSEDLELPFLELNKEIEEDSGMAVNEVIALYGQEGYRRLERQALEQIVGAKDQLVLAVAGGIVSDQGTYEFMLDHFHTVWLKAAPEEHMDRVRKQGDERPMSGNPKAMEALKTILLDRVALYSQADTMVDTSGRTVEESRAELLAAFESFDL